MKQLYFCIFFLISVNGFAQVDSDKDGMPDEWEASNGLDPQDPKDAFADNDGDLVINIYEYQLEADPNNGDQPQSIQYDGSISLEEFITTAPDNYRLMIKAGEYEGDILVFATDETQIMIQGGWDETYSIYDPQTYKTQLSGNDDSEVIRYIHNENEQTFILDGITAKNGEGGIFGALSFTSLSFSRWNLSISNCTMHSNDCLAGLQISHFEGGEASVYIFNNTIYNNQEYGLYLAISKESNVKYNVHNNTIVNNTLSGEGRGLFVSTLGDSTRIDLQMSNNVIFNNVNSDSHFSDRVFVSGSNNILGVFSILFDPVVNLENTIEAIPVFVDEENGDFSPTLGSPQFDAGKDIGIRYYGSAPDLGSVELNLVGTKEFDSTININLSPNPSNHQFSLTSDEPIINKIVVDSYGRVLVENKDLLTDCSEWPTGLYYVLVRTEKGLINIPFIKM